MHLSVHDYVKVLVCVYFRALEELDLVSCNIRYQQFHFLSADGDVSAIIFPVSSMLLYKMIGKPELQLYTSKAFDP